MAVRHRHLHRQRPSTTSDPTIRFQSSKSLRNLHLHSRTISSTSVQHCLPFLPNFDPSIHHGRKETSRRKTSSYGNDVAIPAKRPKYAPNAPPNERCADRNPDNRPIEIVYNSGRNDSWILPQGKLIKECFYRNDAFGTPTLQWLPFCLNYFCKGQCARGASCRLVHEPEFNKFCTNAYKS